MNQKVKLRLLEIAILILIIASIILFSAEFFNSRSIPPPQALLALEEALADELKYESPKSYTKCFDEAKSTKPPGEEWKIVPDECPDDVNIVILVKSSTDRNENRRIIRQTWGTNIALNVDEFRLSTRVIFIIGFPTTFQSVPQINPYLEAESRKFRDILQIDVEDGYIVHHFLRKTLNGFQFVDKLCPRVKMILLADDDSIIAPWLLFGGVAAIEDIMKSANPLFFGGVPFQMDIVPRKISETSRVIFPPDTYPCNSTPIYLQAFALLVSRRTMKLLLEETENYYSSIFLDDIYLSWLAYRLNFTFFGFSKDVYDGWCLEGNRLQSRSRHEIHAMNVRVETLAIFHQCDTPTLQINVWQKLCESFYINKSIILEIHRLYCDSWIKRVLT